LLLGAASSIPKPISLCSSSNSSSREQPPPPRRAPSSPSSSRRSGRRRSGRPRPCAARCGAVLAGLRPRRCGSVRAGSARHRVRPSRIRRPRGLGRLRSARRGSVAAPPAPSPVRRPVAAHPAVRRPVVVPPVVDPLRGLFSSAAPRSSAAVPARPSARGGTSVRVLTFRSQPHMGLHLYFGLVILVDVRSHFMLAIFCRCCCLSAC